MADDEMILVCRAKLHAEGQEERIAILRSKIEGILEDRTGGCYIQIREDQYHVADSFDVVLRAWSAMLPAPPGNN